MTRCAICNAAPTGPAWIPSFLRRFIGRHNGGTIKNKDWHCESCLWVADREGSFDVAGEWLRERARVGAG